MGNPGRGSLLWRQGGAAIPRLPSPHFCPHPLWSRSQLPPHHPACVILLISIKKCDCSLLLPPRHRSHFTECFHYGGSWRGNQALVAPPPATEPPTPVASAACWVRAKLLSASSHFTCPVILGGSSATILILPITKLGSKKVTGLETGLCGLNFFPLGCTASPLAQETAASLGSHTKSR